MRYLGLLLTIACLVTPSVSSAAVPIPVYHSPADDGTPPPSAPVFISPNTGGSLNIWLDPSPSALGLAYGFVNMGLAMSGDFELLSWTCDLPCLQGATTTGLNGSTLFNTGDIINGNDAPFRLGTLTFNLSGSTGSIELVSGLFLDGEFAQQNVLTPWVIAVPEPTALSLLILLGAWTAAGRFRRS